MAGMALPEHLFQRVAGGLQLRGGGVVEPDRGPTSQPPGELGFDLLVGVEPEVGHVTKRR